MKKTFSLLLISTLFITCMQASYLEQLPNNDMYLFINHQKALDELHIICGETNNTKTQAAANEITKNILNNMNTMSSVEQFLYAHDLYQKISNIYPVIFGMGVEKKCYYGSIFISLQSSLRDHNIATMDKYDILSDFDNIAAGDNDVTKSNQFRKQFIKHINLKYNNQATTLPTQKRIKQPIIDETGPEKELAEALVELTTDMTYSTINDMYNQRYITKNEVETLIDKITINYKPNTCTSYHGKFSVQHTIRNGEKHDATISGIEINVNGCYNIFVLEELEDIIELLIIHELGGHLGHYIKDTERKTFEAICRKTKEERNDNCSEKDFVSPYAMTNSYEDYAETFAHRWLNKVSNKTIIINQKMTYMEEMIKRMQMDQ